MRSPLTDTRPSAISLSASRREQIPERAITLAIRSPVFNALDPYFPSCPLFRYVPAMKAQDTAFLQLALGEADSAGKRGEVPVGAVLVAATGEILARAGNRIIELHDPTAHAEMQVLRAASATLGNERLTGTTLYVTLEPCAMCACAISFARVERLVYAASDPKGGAIEHGPKFFELATCHHRPFVEWGLLAAESGELLRCFFRSRR